MCNFVFFTVKNKHKNPQIMFSYIKEQYLNKINNYYINILKGSLISLCLQNHFFFNDVCCTVKKIIRPNNITLVWADNITNFAFFFFFLPLVNLPS